MTEEELTKLIEEDSYKLWQDWIKVDPRPGAGPKQYAAFMAGFDLGIHAYRQRTENDSVS